MRGENELLLVVPLPCFQPHFLQFLLIFRRADLGIPALACDDLEACHHLRSLLAVFFAGAAQRADLACQAADRSLRCRHGLGDLAHSCAECCAAGIERLNILANLSDADIGLCNAAFQLTSLVDGVVPFLVFSRAVCAERFDLLPVGGFLRLQRRDLALKAAVLVAQTFDVRIQLFPQPRIGLELCAQRLKMRILGRDQRHDNFLLLHGACVARLRILLFLLRLGNLFFQRGKRLLRRRCRLVERSDLRRAGQNAAVAAHRAARVGAARVDDLPVERDDLDVVLLFPRHLRRIVKRVKNQSSAENAAHDLGKLLVVVKQQIRSADIARVLPRADHLLGLVLRRSGGERIEGGAPRVCVLQDADRGLCHILIFDRNILNIRAERGFDRGDVFFGHVDQLGDRSVDRAAADPALVICLHHKADAARIALKQLLHAPQRVGAMRAAVQPQLFLRRLCLQILFFAARRIACRRKRGKHGIGLRRVFLIGVDAGGRLFDLCGEALCLLLICRDLGTRLLACKAVGADGAFQYADAHLDVYGRIVQLLNFNLLCVQFAFECIGAPAAQRAYFSRFRLPQDFPLPPRSASRPRQIRAARRPWTLPPSQWRHWTAPVARSYVRSRFRRPYRRCPPHGSAPSACSSR